MASILHSSEDVTQGDPLTIIAYGIEILPLIKNVKREIPNVTHPWYAEDSGALGTFARIETYFDSLKRQGPGWRYHHDPTKSVLIVRSENLEAGKVFGEQHEFRVGTGACHLGGYIGDDEYNCDWLRERTLTWDKNIKTVCSIPGGCYTGRVAPY